MRSELDSPRDPRWLVKIWINIILQQSLSFLSCSANCSLHINTQVRTIISHVHARVYPQTDAKPEFNYFFTSCSVSLLLFQSVNRLCVSCWLLFVNLINLLKKFSRGTDVTVNIQNSPHFRICHYKPLTWANWPICDDWGFSAEHREALKPLCKNWI